MAAVRREEREYASREMRRQNELRDELRNSVEAMEIMIQSQQRIDQLTRSLQELRALHQEMVEAGIGQEDTDDEDEEVLYGGGATQGRGGGGRMRDYYKFYTQEIWLTFNLYKLLLVTLILYF